MKFLTRSNLLATIAGAILGAMQLWGAYEKYWWFDNIAHFLGGVAIGAATTGEDSSRLMDLSVALGIATLWEGFEAWRSIKPWAGETEHDEAVEDTILDTIFVLVGAMLASEAAGNDKQ